MPTVGLLNKEHPKATLLICQKKWMKTSGFMAMTVNCNIIKAICCYLYGLCSFTQRPRCNQKRLNINFYIYLPSHIMLLVTEVENNDDAFER